MTSSELFKKYDVPAPRYTSYPTVPYWSESPTTDQWISALKEAFMDEEVSWSMYMHIPFCESLCTYCGCNTSITRNHDKEQTYIDLLHQEWSSYIKKVPDFKKRALRQLHLGGGSPTFLSAENLTKLLKPILSECYVDYENFEGSVEVDPRITTREHLEALYLLGFQRVSMGVQDFDPEVQRLVNRIQPFSVTEELTKQAREIGYSSINYDLIYGMPSQTVEKIKKSAELTVLLKPDRIALYSLAFVPWIKPQQRLFKKEDLPIGEEKRKLYETARQILLEGGYREIGMDHFALETDSLYRSYQKNKMHRNFMGYSDFRTDVMLGLGVSSISEAPTCFHQNEKVHPVYERRVKNQEVPTLRGHILNKEDQKYREQILTFMTQNQVRLSDLDQEEDVRSFLNSLIEDNLVSIEGGVLKITEQGQPFLRNACMALDHRMRVSKPQAQVFSQSM